MERFGVQIGSRKRMDGWMGGLRSENEAWKDFLSGMIKNIFDGF